MRRDSAASEWERLPTATDGNKLCGETDHFSQFSLIVDATSGEECSEYSNFTACGGDVVGTWTLSGACLPAMPDPDAPSIAGCDTTGFQTITVGSGEISFTDTETTTTLSSITLGGEFEVVLSSCPEPVSCAEIQTALRDGSNGDPGAVCTEAGDLCNCVMTPQTLNPPAGSPKTYTKDGNTLTLDGGDTMDYCVTGNDLVVKLTDADDGEVTWFSASK